MTYSATDSAENNNDRYASLARPVAGSESSAIIGRLTEAGREYLKQNETMLSSDGRASYKFFDFSGNAGGRKLDAMISVATYRVSDRAAVTHAIALIPAISPEQMVVTAEIGDRAYKYQGVASDIFDGEYRDKLVAFIAETVSNAGSISVVGNIPLPAQVKVTDVAIATMISRTIDDLRFSLYSELTKGKSFKISDFVDSETEQLSGVVRYQPGDEVDAFGLPHRRDLSLEVTKSALARSRDANPLSNDASRHVGNVSGYVDYIYLGEDEDRDDRRRRRNRDRDDRFDGIYGIGFNITELTSGDYQLLEAQQLVLQGAVAMVRSDVLVKAMYPAGPSAVLRNSAALNVETEEEGFEFEEKATLDEWMKMNDLVVRDASIYTFMHVAIGGVNSRMHMTFKDACDPTSDNYRTAYSEIYDAANRATDYKFEDYFSREQEIGYIDTRIVLQGTFIDKNGQVRSLEEVDRFFLMTELGLHKRDTEALKLWDRICYDEHLSDAERFAHTEAVLDAALGKGNYNITSRSLVLNLHEDYLEALADAFHAAKLNIATDGVQEEYSRDYRFRGREGYGSRGFRDRARYYAPRSRSYR